MTNKTSRWQTLENHLIKWLIGLATTSIVVAVGFYFNTNIVLAQNTKKIDSLEVEVKKVTTVPVLNQTKIKNIEKELKEFKATQKENHQENKESLKEMRKQQLKMMELLYQIKNQSN